MRKVFVFMLLLSTIAISSFAQNVSKELMKEAKSGKIEAQLDVAKAFMSNNENAKAAKWLYLATQGGNKEAEELFLSFYSKELEKYGKEGNAQAQYVLGNFYLNGQGVNKDLKKAAVWYDMAMTNKHEEAAKCLGSFYNDMLVKRAKKENIAEMQYRLGLCYLNGTEVKVDKEAAAEWLEKAMLQDHKEAGKAFFSFESKLMRKRIKGLYISPIATYVGYVSGNATTGYKYDRSGAAQISIGLPFQHNKLADFEKLFLTITGEKDGDKILNATVESEKMGFSFSGNVIVENQVNYNAAGGIDGSNAEITFLKDGELRLKDQKSPIKTKSDIKLVFKSHKHPEYSRSQFIVSLASDVKNITQKIEVSANEIDWHNPNTPLRMAVDALKPSHIVVNQTLCIEEGRYDSEYILALKKNWFGDTIKINEYNFYSIGDGIRGYTKATLESSDTKIKYDRDKVSEFTKRYKDGFVQYTLNMPGKILYNSKEVFDGYFYFGNLCPQKYNAGGSLENYLDLLNSKNIADIPVVFVKGNYTDEKGRSEAWDNGYPSEKAEVYKKYKEEASAAWEEHQVKKMIAALEEMKVAKEEAKKKLIDERFNKSEVEMLLDRGVIRKGMSRSMIQRAHDLNSNLRIQMECTLDGYPRHLITIFDPGKMEYLFYGYVGYNILGEVYIIE